MDTSVNSVFQLAKRVEEAFNQVGASTMSTAFAAKLMAWLLVRGGSDSAVTTNHALVAGIAVAQQKFGLQGGYIPSKAVVVTIRTYVKQLEHMGDHTPWLKEIYTRYNIKR